MRFKGVIFDLDGTLIDSLPLWEYLGGLYLRKQGKTPEDGLIWKVKAMSLFQSAQYFREHYGLPYTEEEIIAQIDALIEYEYMNEVPLKPHVLPFLERMYKEDVKMCITTATDYYLAKGALDRLGVTKYFEFIMTCTEAGCGKDGPEIYLRSLERLGTNKEETIVFEDALYAVRSAKAAGLYTVGVYDSFSEYDAGEIKELADGYIRSFDEWKD